MDTVKSSKKISLEQSEKIYNDICLITGRAEVSFSSKLIHVIDTSYPIWDRLVAGEQRHFNFANNGWSGYKEYKNAFERYLKSPDGQKIIELFDNKFPGNHISDIKKVDFVLWRDEEGKIEIPQEFKYQG